MLSPGTVLFLSSVNLHNLCYQELLVSYLCSFLQSKELKVDKSFCEFIEFVVAFVFPMPIVCPDVVLVHFAVFYVAFDVDILIVEDLKIFN